MAYMHAAAGHTSAVNALSRNRNWQRLLAFWKQLTTMRQLPGQLRSLSCISEGAIMLLYTCGCQVIRDAQAGPPSSLERTRMLMAQQPVRPQCSDARQLSPLLSAFCIGALQAWWEELVSNPKHQANDAAEIPQPCTQMLHSGRFLGLNNKLQGSQMDSSRLPQDLLPFYACLAYCC